MSNYNVAYSGLDNVSKAIDAVSNNIANASTVGYKAGQWVFADQFMKATSTTDAARTGMGTQNLSVRRPMIQGAIANSTNPLDLAISGNGMFRLLQDIPQGSEGKVSPESLFYTRNGQFSVSRDGFIVNENGMYLTGYQPDRYGKAITDDIYGNWGLLKVPEANYFGNKTGSSVISALLDSTSTAFTSTTSTPFDPSQNTFNNKTSQTIFDNDGNAHTLDVYYRRIADSTFTIKSESDGTGYTYAPSKSSTPYSAADIDKKITLNANSVLRVDTAPLATAAVGTTVTIGTGTFALDANPDANVQGKRVFLNGVDTGYVVQTDPANNSALTLAAGTSPSPSGNGNVTFNQKDIVTFYDVSGTNTLNMTLVTPDGHEILVQGKSNMPSSGLDLTAVESRVEVYSSIDDQFFDHNATSDYFSNRQASQAEMQVSASAYKPVTVMH
ncbi:MAG: hypothetical protein RLZZ470_241, partial [Pseudomonadota bacterium]